MIKIMMTKMMILTMMMMMMNIELIVETDKFKVKTILI